MKKVLVVDDSKVVRKYHSNILKSAGYHVDSASDGEEALEKSLLNQYDVILVDINMPVMDGITYIERYRQEEKETPMIIITTQEESIHKDKGFDAGVNLYVVKPVVPEKLILNIKILLGE